MSDTTDLIARLRDNAQGISLGAEGMGWGFDEAMLNEAAAALEQQAHAAKVASDMAEIRERVIAHQKDIIRDQAAQIEALISVTEETANMLRGMCMDPRIQKDIKEALWSRVRKLDKAAEDAIEAALRQEQPAGEGEK